jgi:exosortase
VFAATVVVSFLLPEAIPGVGLDLPYFFVTVLVLFAWFLIKWDGVKKLQGRSGTPETIAGFALIAGDYALNAYRGSTVGIADLIVVFLGSVIAVYGVRSLRFFWVPAAYGVVLLAGYQIEAVTPNYVALQNWLAGLMGSAVNAMGIRAFVYGHVVSMDMPNGSPILLDVAGACTGLQGILAFGMLSTMALLDTKPVLSRVIPIFAIGFLGAFLTNIVRLLVVFLTFEYLGVDAGTAMHVYFGYLVFIAWVLAFWAIAFRYLLPRQSPVVPQTAVTVAPMNQTSPS